MANPNAKGRPVLINKEFKKAFLEKLKENKGSLVKTYQDMDISEAGVYGAKQKDKKFKEAIKQIQKDTKRKHKQTVHYDAMVIREQMLEKAKSDKATMQDRNTALTAAEKYMSQSVKEEDLEVTGKANIKLTFVGQKDGKKSKKKKKK